MTEQHVTDIWTALDDQGRNQVWLARQTGKAAATVRAYKCGVRRTPDAWVRKARAALGLAEQGS
jgi:hypothetical protein